MKPCLRNISIALILTLSVQACLAQSGIFGNKDLKQLNLQRQVPYYLPYNQLALEFEIDFIQVAPGRFSKQAESLLGLNGMRKDTLMSCYVSSLEVSMITTADPAARFSYYDQSKKGSSFHISTNPEMILHYAGSTKGFSEESSKVTPPYSIKKHFQYHLQNSRMQALDAMEFSRPAVSKSSNDTSALRIEAIPAYKEKPEQKLASEIATRILDLQAARLKLLSGYQEIPYSYDAISYMDQGLKEMQEDYLRLFTGDTFLYTQAINLRIDPSHEETGKWITLFRLDQHKGVLPASARIGEECKIRLTPVILDIEDDSTDMPPDTIVMNMESMVYYREPLLVQVEVMFGNKILLDQHFLFSQLGKLGYLPLKNLDITLDPVTGAPTRIIYRNK